MKVLLPDMYEAYIIKAKAKRDRLDDIYNTVKERYDDIEEMLDTFKEYANYTNCPFDKIDDMTTKDIDNVHELHYTQYQNSIEAINKPHKNIIDYKMMLKAFLFQRDRLFRVIDMYSTLPPIINKPLYCRIMREFCRELQRELLDGFKFNPGHRIGSFQIVRKRNYFKDSDVINNRRVNWRATIENKNRLLAEGKELYNSATETGEKYFIYFDTDYSLWLFWNKSRCLLKNKTLYSLVPAEGDKHVVKIGDQPKDLNIDQIANLATGFITKIKYIEQHRQNFHSKYRTYGSEILFI